MIKVDFYIESIYLCKVYIISILEFITQIGSYITSFRVNSLITNYFVTSINIALKRFDKHVYMLAKAQFL